jgi:hypothetical protein
MNLPQLKIRRVRENCSGTSKQDDDTINTLRLNIFIQWSALLILAMALPSCSVLEPEPDLVPLSVTVREDSSFNQLFKRCGPGWTGGDSTYSTALSPTQVLWLFSDTFIGPVTRDGKRNPDAATFVQGNTLVLQDATSGTLTTYLRKAVRKTVGDEQETQSLPTFPRSPYDDSQCPGENFVQNNDALAMFQPPQCPSGQHCYYWGGALAVENNQLTTFLQLMEQTGAGIFDFAWRESAIATVPSDKLATAEPAYVSVPNNGVSYGGAVISDDDKYTYIYGMREESAGNSICSGRCIHIARAPKDKLARPEEWRYWGATASTSARYAWTERTLTTHGGQYGRGCSTPNTGSAGRCQSNPVRRIA